jgi:hypothetical protein
MYTKTANKNSPPLFEVETFVFQPLENNSEKVINLSTGEVKNKADFKGNPTWDKVILKAEN